MTAFRTRLRILCQSNLLRDEPSLFLRFFVFNYDLL
jgi:hypothetical protein